MPFRRQFHPRFQQGPATVPGVSTRTTSFNLTIGNGINGGPATGLRPEFTTTPFVGGQPGIASPPPQIGFDPCGSLMGSARLACEAARGFVQQSRQECPPGSINTRNAILTGILGPRCEPIGDPTGRQPEIPLPGPIPGIPVPPGMPGAGMLPTRADPTMAAPGQIGSAPMMEAVTRRQCPRGPDGRAMVIAIDGRCYPKPMVPKRFRANPPRPKPVVSQSDQKAIRKADAARKRLVKLTKAAGAHASMTKPRSQKRIPPHQHAIPARAVSVR